MNPARSSSKPGSSTGQRRRIVRTGAPPKAAACASDVLMQFRTIIRTIRQHYRQVHERCGVSGAQLWVLAAVNSGNGVKVNDIACHLAIHQSTASNLLDKLEHLGMVERRRGDDDRRVVRVHLTGAGRAALRRAPKPAEGVLPEALQALSLNELLALRVHLASLIRHMHAHVTSAGRVPISELLERDEPRRVRTHRR